jgi:hypothetical protein
MGNEKLFPIGAKSFFPWGKLLLKKLTLEML